MLRLQSGGRRCIVASGARLLQAGPIRCGRLGKQSALLVQLRREWLSAFRLRVAAAFLAEAERSAAERDEDASPPFFPQLCQNHGIHRVEQFIDILLRQRALINRYELARQIVKYRCECTDVLLPAAYGTQRIDQQNGHPA